MRMIALDMGSSFTKAALLAEGSVQLERQLPTPPPLKNGNGRYEIDAEEYGNQVLSLIDSLLDRAPADGILLSTQMHGCLLTDASLRPCTPYISWQDGLGAAYLPRLRQVLTDGDVSPSGVALKGNLALCSLLARRAEGESWPANARFHTLGGYIIARLTGRHVCHITNAAPTGLADIRRGDWNAVLLDKAGLSGLTMPEITDSLAPVGTYRGARVYPDLGDQQVCAWGAGLREACSLHVNVGTAGLLGALSREFCTSGCESRPWLEKGLYLRTVSGLMGGRHLQRLRETYSAPEADVWAMLTASPDEAAMTLYWEMAEDYRRAAMRMGFPIRELCFSGGCVLKNPPLRRCIARAFGLAENDCTTASDIWKGMLALADKIERERYDGQY